MIELEQELQPDGQGVHVPVALASGSEPGGHDARQVPAENMEEALQVMQWDGSGSRQAAHVEYGHVRHDAEAE